MNSHEKKDSCCESAACCESSGKGLTALLIIIATVANIGASYFFSTQVTKAALENEYAKMGGKETYDLLNEAQRLQIEKQIPQIKSYVEGERKNKPATDAAVKDGDKPTTPEADKPATEPAKPEAKKSDRPTVDLYIMSYCPYGLQAQKPFVLLMDKFAKYADMNIRFVPYVMHGLKEAKENAVQACIRNEQNDKYVAYAKCFVKEEGKGAECLKEAKVDTKKLDKCAVALMEKEGGNSKYENAPQGQFPSFMIDSEGAKAANVEGSPTLVINGTKIENVGRTQDGYAKAICAAFTDGKQPAVCKETFSTDNYPPMFGMTASANGGAPAAGCGQ